MKPSYHAWLSEQAYTANTITSQLHRVQKVEEYYGNLDDHYVNDTYENVINELTYSTKDERLAKPNPSKIRFDGNIRNNLQSYKNAVVRYRKFLAGTDLLNEENSLPEKYEIKKEIITARKEEPKQKFALERDMQAALRRNIHSLEQGLLIADDGAERAVDSGLIDITCDDGESFVVVELKAGTADSRAIAQILGYMGDLQEEEDRPVRGILVAHDFDKRTKAAAKVVPTLTLKRYSITFAFEDA